MALSITEGFKTIEHRMHFKLSLDSTRSQLWWVGLRSALRVGQGQGSGLARTWCWSRAPHEPRESPWGSGTTCETVGLGRLLPRTPASPWPGWNNTKERKPSWAPQPAVHVLMGWLQSWQVSCHSAVLLHGPHPFHKADFVYLQLMESHLKFTELYGIL